MISFELKLQGYELDFKKNIWKRPNYLGIPYSDGSKVEERLLSILDNIKDLSVLSNALREHCTDWASNYHLSHQRANLLRPFESDFSGDILEIGSGCGAITRYLGECGGNVLSLEGTLIRASITRSRTRDLKNVTVVSDNFDQFTCDKKFDVVTLIGVLEYANLFSKDKNPIQYMLSKANSFLKPNGKLIIAIENQIGLKYFAGAAEDHYGIPMLGIEGRYKTSGIRTFGRTYLKKLLNISGFASCQFYAPFPDYKLVSTIITETGFQCGKFNAATLIAQTVGNYNQLPKLEVFCQETAWNVIQQNKLGMDFANSFLVVASGTELEDRKNVLAWYFNTSRSPKYCKRIKFLKSGSKIVLDSDNLITENTVLINKPITQKIKKKTPYYLGITLQEQLINQSIKEDFCKQDIFEFYKKYLEILKNLVENYTNNFIKNWDFNYLVDGKFFDCIPQNIIKDKNNYQYIDDEWIANFPIEVGYLLFRALLNFKIPYYLNSVNFNFLNTKNFIIKTFFYLDVELTEKKLSEYINLEYSVQSQVNEHIIPFDQYYQNFEKKIIFRSNIFNTLNSLTQVTQAKEQEIVNLTQVTQAKDREINEILNSTCWKITSPLRFLGRIATNPVDRLKYYIKRIGTALVTMLKRSHHHLPISYELKKDIYRTLCTRFPGIFGDNAGKPSFIGPNHLSKEKIKDHFVSIIIVNYNGLNHLECLINSICNQTYKKFEIIFVDNNSIDESVNFIKKNYPKVKIVVNNKNLYFAEANNVGFEKSIGNLILLLNNDTVIEHDFLERLVTKYNQNKEIVAVTPKILFFKKFFKLSLNFNENVYLDYGCLIDNLEYKKSFIKSSHDVTENIIQTNDHELIFYLPENENIILKFKPEAVFNKNLIKNIKINDEIFHKFENRNNFEVFITKSFTINKDNKYIINNAGSANYKNPYDVGFGEIDIEQYKNKKYSELICGCAVLIDRYAIGYNKLFISEFKNYYEDSELSNRLKQKGKIAFENNAVVYHKHSATSIEHSTHWQYYVARNKILYDYLLFNETNIENKLNNFLSNKTFKDVTKEKKKILSDINNLIKKEKKLFLKPNVKRVAIYNEYWNTYGGGEKRALDFIYELKLSDCCIDLISSSDFDIQNLKKYFNHNNLKLRKRIINIKIENISNEYDVFINSTYLSNLISFAKKSFFLISFPQKKVTQEFLNSYTFVPNSKYTLSWAKKYWGKNFDSKLIYPKSDFDIKNLAISNNKKKVILSVGRWTPLGHSKKQFEMAQMFTRLTKSEKYKDWSLVLAGSLNSKNSVETEYFNKVKNYLEFNKLNFELHYNLERNELIRLYSESSIYWQFTGFNEDLKNKPELAEHFGMTLVEAIAHGCIPFAFNAGGPVEILECLKSNNTFSNFDELDNKMQLITKSNNFEINQNFKKKFY
jgi:GT2 family glycosyltransferase